MLSNDYIKNDDYYRYLDVNSIKINCSGKILFNILSPKVKMVGGSFGKWLMETLTKLCKNDVSDSNRMKFAKIVRHLSLFHTLKAKCSIHCRMLLPLGLANFFILSKVSSFVPVKLDWNDRWNLSSKRKKDPQLSSQLLFVRSSGQDGWYRRNN